VLALERDWFMQLRRLGVTLAVVMSVFACSALSSSVHAQSDEPTPVEASPKGKIGFGFLGAELGVAIPAIIGMNQWWAYVVFPVVGAAGGAVLGHLWIDNGNHAELSVVFLTAGMTLVIPTLVLAAAATAYDPEENLSDEASLGSGAVRFDQGALRLRPPGVSVLPDARVGKLNVSGVHVSLLSGRF
jgi:hypothetical protein